MRSEFEMWLPLDRDLVSRADWSVRSPPWLIAEPAPEPPEPEVPVWFTEGVAAPPRRRRRRKRPLALLTAAVVCILALGGAAYVTGLLPLRSGAAARETDGGAKGSPALVVTGPAGQEFTCTRVGTPDGDRLTGTEDRDVICGLGGADRLDGDAGADVLLGGDGDDTLVGGRDSDRIYGEAGRDEIHARDGFADRLDGGPGRDRADAGWLDDSSRSVESFDDRLLVAAGDIACDPETVSYNEGLGTARRCHQRATGALVEAIEPDVVLVLGDAQYEDARYSKYLQSYDPTWGRFKEITYPTVGRAHDAFGRGGYYRYWGERAGPRGSLWQSFDLGGWHLVSLNSNCVLAGGCDAGSPQERWLRADLAESKSKCTIAFWSEPLFSSSRPRSLSVQPLWQTLYDFGVEIVLNGDAHNYEVFRPLAPNGARDRRGIRQFIVGTGGKSLVPFDRVARGSVVREAETFGVLTLRLQRAEYEWEFVPELEGGFTNAGSDTCH